MLIYFNSMLITTYFNYFIFLFTYVAVIPRKNTKLESLSGY